MAARREGFLMRSIQRLLRDVVLATLVTVHPALLGCGGTGANVPCASSIEPQVSVDITYTVRAYYHTAENATKIPIPLCRMTISTIKLLCEGDAKGYMFFPSSYTNALGTYEFTVGYNLHNRYDAIEATVDVFPDTISIPWPLQPRGNTGVKDTITYDVAATASNGSLRRTIEVDVLAGR
jgi:hypothetical protein